MKHESFDGHAPTQIPCDRYFFALLPPAREARRATQLAEQLGEGWSVQSARRLHVTLAITNDFEKRSAAVEERLLEAGERISVAPFAMTLDMQSIGQHSAALRPGRAIKGLTALHRAIRALWPADLAELRTGWSFSPHMTLAYREGGRPSTRPVEPLRWQAERVVLIRSLVGRTRHETLGDWPLANAQYALF